MRRGRSGSSAAASGHGQTSGAINHGKRGRDEPMGRKAMKEEKKDDDDDSDDDGAQQQQHISKQATTTTS
jgi:hypothetical protein